MVAMVLSRGRMVAMAVLNVSIVLIASYPDGRNVGRTDFVAPLVALPSDQVTSVTFDGGAWTSSSIEFLNSSLDSYRAHAEPSEAFFEDVERTFAGVANWIDERRDLLRSVRESGLELTLLVDMVIDQDQMELVLCAAVLRAAGEASIPIQLITND
jgi:hypothetical protein